MKKVFFIALMAVFAINISAQTEVKISVNAGLGISNYYGNGAEDEDVKVGYKVGVGVEVPFSELLSLQTGLNYLNKGSNESAEYDGKINANYLELPMMLGVRLETQNDFSVLLKGGGYVAYGIGGKTSIKEDGFEVRVNTFDTMKKFDAGVGCGVGFEFSKIVVGIDAQLGLCNVLKDDYNTPKNISAFINVGYKF